MAGDTRFLHMRTSEGKSLGTSALDAETQGVAISRRRNLRGGEQRADERQTYLLVVRRAACGFIERLTRVVRCAFEGLRVEGLGRVGHFVDEVGPVLGHGQ